MKTAKFLTVLAVCGMLAPGAQGARITQDVSPNLPLAARDDGGWQSQPNPYQFFDAERIVAEMHALPAARAHVPGTDFALSNFLAYLNLPQGKAVESKTNTNTVRAAERISEPASELLMLVALGGLAIVVRRKMPE